LSGAALAARRAQCGPRRRRPGGARPGAGGPSRRGRPGGGRRPWRLRAARRRHLAPGGRPAAGGDGCGGMVGALAGLLRRDLRLALRQGSDALLVVGFFVMATLLFPFGVGPEPNLLARIATGVIWATALLSALLSFDRLFQADFEDGSLDQLVLAPP